MARRRWYSAREESRLSWVVGLIISRPPLRATSSTPNFSMYPTLGFTPSSIHVPPYRDPCNDRPIEVFLPKRDRRNEVIADQAGDRHRRGTFLRGCKREAHIL